MCEDGKVRTHVAKTFTGRSSQYVNVRSRRCWRNGPRREWGHWGIDGRTAPQDHNRDDHRFIYCPGLYAKPLKRAVPHSDRARHLTSRRCRQRRSYALRCSKKRGKTLGVSTLWHRERFDLQRRRPCDLLHTRRRRHHHRHTFGPNLCARCNRLLLVRPPAGKAFNRQTDWCA